jgi:hypothetical protein
MNSNPSQASPSLSTVLTVIAMALACIGVVIGMCLRLAQSLEPSVGDIAEFIPGQSVRDMPPVAVTAHEAGRSCVLSSDVMAQSGGSLLIVLRGPAAAGYVVHWAGARTSSGATDCGASADLSVSKPDLLSLSGTASGFGFHHQHDT